MSPEAIFQNKIPMLNANFIQPVSETMDASHHGSAVEAIYGNNTESSLNALRNYITKWYVALRILALAGLLTILVYTGIKIIISSAAQDRAKYKERLMDWVVALCLLFSLHYIMLLTFRISESIVDMLGKSIQDVPLKNGDYLEVGDILDLVAVNQLLDENNAGCRFEWNHETERDVWFTFKDTVAIDIDGDTLGFLKPPEFPNYVEGWAGRYNWDAEWLKVDFTGGNSCLVMTNGDQNPNLEDLENLATFKNFFHYLGAAIVFWDESLDSEELEVKKREMQSWRGDWLHDTDDPNRLYVAFASDADVGKPDQAAILVGEDMDNNLFKEFSWIKFYQDGSYKQFKLNLKDTSGDEIGDPVNDLTLEYLQCKTTTPDGVTDQEWTNLSNEGEEYKCKGLINFVRLYTEVKQSKGAMMYSYMIIYVVLTIYTIMFLLRYIRRYIYLAFLTLMAPLVALSYPIDKMKDGQAQGFNMWLKEFIFNVIIQPFHLLIYVVLVGASIELASTNLVYSVVAIGFILPAENLIRKFFGFEAASTLDKAGSFGAGALTATLFNALKKKPKLPGLGGGKGKGKDDDGSDSSEDRNQIHYHNPNEGSALDEIGGGRLGPASSGPDEENNDDYNQQGDNTYNGLGLPEASDENTIEGNARVLSEGEAEPLSDEEMANSENINPNWERTPDGNGYVDMDPRRRLSDEENARIRTRPTRYTGNKKKRSKVWAATKAGFRGAFGKGKIGRRVIKGVAKGAKIAAKIGAGSILAGTGLIIGAGVGIASGDASKAVQYGTLGLTAGAYAGSNAVDGVTGLAKGGYNLTKRGYNYTKDIPKRVKAGANEIRADYHRQADSPEEYQAYLRQVQMEQKEEEMKKFKKDDTYLKQEFGNAEATRIMDEALPTYFDYNITNGKEIAAIENTRRDIQENIMEENPNISEEDAREQARAEAIQSFRINKELKDRGISKHKDKVAEIKERLSRYGLSEDESTQRAENIVENGNAINNNISRRM